MLSAKLFVYAVAGAAYGLILATTEGLALYGGAAVRGLTVGAEPAVVLRILLSLMITMTVYTVLGVGVGTVLRNQTATLTVLGGYLYMVEHSLAIIPGFQQIYPFLSGSATASLTDFTLLSQAAVELGITATPLLPPVIGAGVLAGYGITAAALAVLMPLRRQVTCSLPVADTPSGDSPAGTPVPLHLGGGTGIAGDPGGGAVTGLQ